MKSVIFGGVVAVLVTTGVMAQGTNPQMPQRQLPVPIGTTPSGDPILDEKITICLRHSRDGTLETITEAFRPLCADTHRRWLNSLSSQKDLDDLGRLRALTQ